MINATPYVNNM